MIERVAAAVWEDEGGAARAARLALTPAAAAYGATMALRNELYRRGVLRSVAPPIPVVSIGNLTVGGTGKTPVSAWLADELRARGARPAVVLRGYGGDEPLVHRRLHPTIPVVVSPDRAAGVTRAARLGATVAVLDDAFQHRRLRRDVDVVLVSADADGRTRRLLPAGPWREPMTAVRRASIAIVTRKAATPADAERTAAAVRSAAPAVPIAVTHLALGGLRRADTDEERPLAAVAGRRVLAVAAVGDPRAFARQLAATGAVVRTAVFADHYRFGAADAERLAASLADGETAVCTLKDAVKLAAHWPRAAPPLWYVSQRVVVECGQDAIDGAISALLRARTRQP